MPVTELSEFVVTVMRMESPVERVPAAVSVVSAESIQRARQQLSLDESLRGVPGVFVLNPYTFAQDPRLAIRGFGSRADFGIRGIQLLVDGIPATLPDGQGSVDGIDFGSVERIEIIRGPAAALYGASSGGVLLITTGDGTENPFLETRLSAGEFGFAKAQAKAGGEAGPLNYLVHGSHLEFDGYRDHSRTRNWKFNSKLRFTLDSKASLTAVINWIDMPQQDDPGGLTLEETEDNPRQARDRNLFFKSGEEVRQGKLGLVYRKDFNEFHSLELRSFYVHRDFANRLPFEDGGQVTLERDFWGGGIQYGFTGSRARFASGLDFGRQDDARKNFDNLEGDRGSLVLDQGEVVTSLGLFAHCEYEILPRVTLSASLRYDRVAFEVEDALLADGDDSGNLDFSEVSPMAGVAWKAFPGVSLFANASTSFETPTTTEFDNPDGGGFNESLRSQTARSFEVGARGDFTFLSRPARYDVAAFHADIEDVLVPYELDAFPDREFFRNAGASRHRGIEAALALDLLPELTVSLSWTWSDFLFTDYQLPDGDYSGNRIPALPEHFADLGIRYLHPDGLYLQWNLRWSGRMFADDANSTSVDQSWVADLRAGYEFTAGRWNFEPFLGLNNMFAESYYANIRINAFAGRFYEPGPLRNFYAGVRVRFRL